MKTIFTFLVAMLIVLSTRSQVVATGITTYTNNGIGNPPIYLNAQNPSQDSLGNIWFLSNFRLCKFSGGTFTTYTTAVAYTGILATNSGVWCYSKNTGSVSFFNGSFFTDYSSNILALIGTINSTNTINYMGAKGSSILFATNKGLIIYNGTGFLLLNTGNSNLNCDTINTVVKYGSIALLGTNKGVCSFNGFGFYGFTSIPSTSVQSVRNIFTDGTHAIITINTTALLSGYYDYTPYSLTKRPAMFDSVNYHSFTNTSIGFLNSTVVFPKQNMFSAHPSPAFKLVSASGYTNSCDLPYGGANQFYFFNYPGNNQKFYLTAQWVSGIMVYLVDLNIYMATNPTGNQNQIAYLDTNNVSAYISETNLKHWEIFGRQVAHYQVPKTTNYITGVSSQFASAIWVGGLDNMGKLHISAQTYHQNGTDFWPGPLDTTNASSTFLNIGPYNRIWKNSCNQINQFVNNANTGNASINASSTSFESINSYPANGTVTNNIAAQLSPFFDVNNNGKYEPNLGEYPIIKGHQQIYSIYNDAFSTHGETGGLPLGLEIHDKSFSYNLPSAPDTMQVINFSTFYNYEIYNRSNTNYNNVYVTLWSDFDLGYYLDDYTGTDTLNNFGYAYNATNYDPTAAGVNGYLNKVPMQAYALIQKPSAQTDGIDNNNNGVIDEPGENFKLNVTTYYNNNVGNFPPQTANPNVPYHYYNYMEGRWKDSSMFTFGGTAYNPTLSLPPTKYIFPGNPQVNTGWTEGTAGNLPGDRRILCTIGPFNFLAHKKIEVEYAYVFSRDTSLNNVNNNFSLLQRDVRNVKYFQSSQGNQCSPTLVAAIKENANSLMNLWIYPNPTQNILNINLNKNVEYANINVLDISGRIIIAQNMKNTYTKILNIEQLANGVYFVEVQGNNFKMTQKIIKN